MWRYDPYFCSTPIFANAIYEYYEKTHGLPDHPAIGDSGWPTDPFNDKPLCYMKIGEKHFIVFSVGPDKLSQNGKSLFVGNLRSLPQGLYDIGFHFLLRSN